MKLLTINISGKHSGKELRELQAELYNIIVNHLNGYAKHRIIGDKSVTINLVNRNEETEAWLKSRSYHE